MAPIELAKLKTQLEELLSKRFIRPSVERHLARHLEFLAQRSWDVAPGMKTDVASYIKKIRSRMLVAQSHKKSYADQRRKPLEFEKGEHVFLKVTLATEYTPDASHVLEPESVQVREDLTLQVTPVRIDDTSIKRLRDKEVSLVKVAWNWAGIEQHTWELESEMRKDYPHLFSDNQI
ncbi:uncharacterized protein LOC130934384 [Arachis stenosperma]|uniref:uncharacterized protein LOC130934384 n=1 Tax=Arachis stenosperma TaxID=217475 RepID=UPI0025ACF356|nr:uncharacterized protein LOC130934384 [Arachis stenosperma]